MDEKMEIRLVNPTEDGFLQRIDWNKAERRRMSEASWQHTRA